MKNIRNCLEQIPESISAFIDKNNLSMTNDDFIDSIIDRDNWKKFLFGYNDPITLINKIFDVKFIPEYAKYYDELCKISIEGNSYNIRYIKPKYCTIYDELCRFSVIDNVYNIKCINPAYCTIYNEICKIAVLYNSSNIKYINPRFCTIYDELKEGIS